MLLLSHAHNTPITRPSPVLQVSAFCHSYDFIKPRPEHAHHLYCRYLRFASPILLLSHAHNTPRTRPSPVLQVSAFCHSYAVFSADAAFTLSHILVKVWFDEPGYFLAESGRGHVQVQIACGRISYIS